MHTYPATVSRIVDGDTLHAAVTFPPFPLSLAVVVRLARINAPELKTPDGPRARARLNELCGMVQVVARPAPVTLGVHGHDPYGRYVCEVVLTDGRNCSDVLLAEGLAQPWPAARQLAGEGS